MFQVNFSDEGGVQIMKKKKHSFQWDSNPDLQCDVPPHELQPLATPSPTLLCCQGKTWSQLSSKLKLLFRCRRKKGPNCGCSRINRISKGFSRRSLYLKMPQPKKYNDAKPLKWLYYSETVNNGLHSCGLRACRSQYLHGESLSTVWRENYLSRITT